MPRLKLQEEAKEANETRSTEEILVEEAESSGDDDIVKEPGGQETPSRKKSLKLMKRSKLKK